MNTASSLAADVAALCAWPERVPGSEGHAAAREHVVRRFKVIGLAPYDGRRFELPYEHRRQRFVNVLGVAQGREPAAAPVVIGAHYDTVAGTPGADDNAAAIAVALEVAQRLAVDPAARPVVLAHFDAEEPPYFHTQAMGSTHFVGHQMLGPVHAALILDLVGHAVVVAGLDDVLGVLGSESHPQLARSVDAHAGALLPLVTLPNRILSDMSDHRAFRLAGHPYLFLTCGQWQHYHRWTDTPDRLDYDKMVRVADLLEALVRDVSDLEMDGAREHDTTELDTRHLQRLLGPHAQVLGLDGPDDFDRVIRRVIAEIQGC